MGKLKSPIVQNDPGLNEVLYFPGISISGGKADKSCVSILQYYPSHNKVFLTKLIEKIHTEDRISADQKIYDILEGLPKERVKYVALDAPLSLPKCITCSLKCPGYENCSEPEIQWMWGYYDRIMKKKRPKRLFTPYTQRCAEMYISDELEENFYLHHGLGANMAPLSARAIYVQKRIEHECIEVRPKVSLWRIGSALGINKSHLRFHRHAVGGDESRMAILTALSEHNLAFLYTQDFNTMVKNNHAFESFLCAFTGFLKHKGQTEPRPEGFPNTEGWIEYPLKTIAWD